MVQTLLTMSMVRLCQLGALAAGQAAELRRDIQVKIVQAFPRTTRHQAHLNSTCHYGAEQSHLQVMFSSACWHVACLSLKWLGTPSLLCRCQPCTCTARRHGPHANLAHTAAAEVSEALAKRRTAPLCQSAAWPKKCERTLKGPRQAEGMSTVQSRQYACKAILQLCMQLQDEST